MIHQLTSTVTDPWTKEPCARFAAGFHTLRVDGIVINMFMLTLATQNPSTLSYDEKKMSAFTSFTTELSFFVFFVPVPTKTARFSANWDAFSSAMVTGPAYFLFGFENRF